MANAQEVIQEVFQVIEGGSTLGQTAEIIQFPTDNGQTVYNVVEKTYKGTNGTGFNYWVVAFETLVGETMMAVSAGAAMLTLEVGAAGVAIAPALGLTTGYVLYNLSPEFWDSVAEELTDAGETIGGKVVTFMNENGVLTFSENAIEIFKNAFRNAGAYELIEEMPEHESSGTCEIVSSVSAMELFKYGQSLYGPYLFSPEAQAQLTYFFNEHPNYLAMCSIVKNRNLNPFPTWFSLFWLIEPTSQLDLGGFPPQDVESWTISIRTTCDGYSIIVSDLEISGPHSGWGPGVFTGEYSPSGTGTYAISGINATFNNENGLQNGAIAPTEDPFPLTFPRWFPWEFPVIIGPTGDPLQLPHRYPLEYPEKLPIEEPYQDPAQKPDDDTETDPDIVKKTLEDPDNDINTDGQEEGDDDPDPDTGDDPDPITGDVDDPVPPDPIPPDPDPIVTPVIPVVPLPNTVDSNKLFTVYNPSQSQLNALGGYLWDNDLIDILRKIWQNPLDGIISLIQVYATPSVGASRNIILGYLDSGVSAPVVSNQFVTIDCGTVTVDELSENCLDYIPYTKLELYLPFIGVTEIDTNEFMEGSINVKYKVDVYTGTCLAEVKCTRSRDLANGTILYTFNGNCSQQIPLTSGDARGVLSALIGAAGLGLSIASGGASAITGAGLLKTGARVAGELGGTTSKEMLHVSHSGNLSANAGIMGQKKPYLIINRDRPYTANTYNKFYGFPANKTAYLGNHSGFLRVKAGRLRTAATENEKKEIYDLLTTGVIM